MPLGAPGAWGAAPPRMPCSGLGCLFPPHSVGYPCGPVGISAGLCSGFGGWQAPASACLPATARANRKEEGFSLDLSCQLLSVRTCLSLGGTDIRKDTPFTEDPSLCLKGGAPPWVPWTATPSNTPPTNLASVGGGGWQGCRFHLRALICWPGAGGDPDSVLPPGLRERQTVRDENAP